MEQKRPVIKALWSSCYIYKNKEKHLLRRISRATHRSFIVTLYITFDLETGTDCNTILHFHLFVRFNRFSLWVAIQT